MALSLNQVQKQTQKLIMTPQMQQSIQLLQMSAQELEQLATQEMIENPFLEIAEESDSGEEEKTQEEAEQAPEDTEVIDFTFSSPSDIAPVAPTESASTSENAEGDHFG